MGGDGRHTQSLMMIYFFFPVRVCGSDQRFKCVFICELNARVRTAKARGPEGRLV